MDGTYGQDVVLLYLAIKWTAIFLGSLCALGGLLKLAEIILERTNRKK